MSRNLSACLSAAQERSEHGLGYPRFVEREFKKYLDCGQLRQGLVRVKCADCPNEKLVAFSCKGRGICPSCTARRMSNTAAHMVDKVLPALPYRQWVLSFPKRVRFRLATDHDLLSRVLDIALRKVFAWQRRAARRLGITAPMCGAIGFVQRFGSLVNLNCHFHNILPDGVFTENNNGDVVFRPVPPPTKRDEAKVHAQNVVRAVNHSEDRFRDSEEQFYSLTTRLSSREAGAMGHSDLEQLIEKEGRELMRRLFQDHLGLRAQRENERGLTGPVVGAEGEQRTHQRRET
ncbi:MAG: transposase, partial [Myxococcales bacterium]|nr:transposase [Myxococcales bacterium]